MSYRPDYHITPKKGWINDPNGFVFFNGEYHLYAQHNPYDTVWGPMHWLHFVSRDLHNWTEKGIALKPSAPYDKEFGCFSGSSIVKDDKLFVLYTGANGDKQVQCLAVSKDGYNFEKYPYNPVIDEDDLPDGYLVKDFRDPKIVFQNDTYYVLLAARHKDGYSSILLYKSKDLIHYEFVNVLKSFNNMVENGMVECPDVVFENGKACLIYSFQHPSNYEKDFTVCSQVGHIDLDKGIFVPTGEEKELEQGFVGYASHTLTKDKHNYYISWLHSWGINSPTAKEGYVGVLSLVKTLHIHNDYLRFNFLLDNPNTYLYEGYLTDDIAEINLSNIKIILEKKTGIVTLLRKDMDVEIKNEKGKILSSKQIKLKDLSRITLEVCIDKSIIELLFNKGEAFVGIDNYIQDCDSYRISVKGINLE